MGIGDVHKLAQLFEPVLKTLNQCIYGYLQDGARDSDWKELGLLHNRRKEGFVNTLFLRE